MSRVPSAVLRWVSPFTANLSEEALRRAVPLQSLRSLQFSTTVPQQAGEGPSVSDPFTQELQKKTERELAEMLAANQAKKAAAGGGTAGEDSDDDDRKANLKPARDDEIGGPKGAEPTRFGDWERNGRCTDF